MRVMRFDKEIVLHIRAVKKKRKIVISIFDSLEREKVACGIFKKCKNKILKSDNIFRPRMPPKIDEFQCFFVLIKKIIASIYLHVIV